MKRFTFITALMFLLVVNVFATKRALVIGLGKQEDKNWSKINGDKDVNYVKAMLGVCGYKAANIKTLVNEKATKKGIVDAFNNMANQCRNGDIVYIHFSGHGQQVMDKNKMKRESWVPYDAYYMNCEKDRGNNHLIDFEINALLNKIYNKIGYKGKMMVVVDACCSGGSTRGDDDEDEQDEDLLPSRGAKDVFNITAFVMPMQDLKVKWIALGACRSYQKAWEITQPQIMGKLTYVIYSISKNGRVDFNKIKTKFEELNKGKKQDPVEERECSYNIWDVLK